MTSFRKPFLAACSLLLVMAALAFSPPSTVGAEIAPVPTTYWGVSGIEVGTVTDDIESEVWAIEQIGDRVFVGGKFTHVTNEGNEYPRPYIAAFDSVTGVWIDSFAPPLDGPVYALQASPDGSRLFVGGEFDTYNGSSARGMIALDPLTGASDWSWRARAAGGGNVVRNFDVEGNWLYVAGNFTAVKNNGVGPTVSNVARVDINTGIPDASFTPDIRNGSVWGIDASPTSQYVYLAGYFESLEGRPNTTGFAAVDNAGNYHPTGYIPNTTNRNYMQDVETVNGNVFIGGSQHILAVYRESDWTLLKSHHTNGSYHALSVYRDANYEGFRQVFSAGERQLASYSVGRNQISSVHVADGYTLELCTGISLTGECIDLTGYNPTLPEWIDNQSSSMSLTRDVPGPELGRGGDYQDLEVVGNRVYASCHCWGDHYSSNQVRDWDAYETPEGTWVDAQWIHAYSASTGEHVDSFASGITNSGSGPWAIHGADNGCLWVGGGVTGASGQPSKGFARLCDSNLDVTPPTEPAGLAVAGFTNDSVDLTWEPAEDNASVASYLVFDDATDAVLATVDTTSATIADLPAGIELGFYVKAKDSVGNLGARSNVATQTLGAADVPTNCVADNVGRDATITWDTVDNALDYRVTRSIDGSEFYWRGVPKEATLTDELRGSGMHTYQVQARGADLQWSDATSCAPALDPIAGLPPILAPANCVATQDGSTVNISWDESDNAVGYRISRSVADSEVFWRGFTTDTSLADDLRSSGVHAYFVEAKGADDIFTEATACSPTIDPTPAPVGAPVSCSATADGVNATISWEPTEGASDYRVFRSIDGGTNYWRAVTANTSFDDTLRNSGLHVYTVQARQDGGPWSDSTVCDGPLDPTAGQVPAGPVPSCVVTAVGLDATITWAPAANATDYRVYRAVAGGNSFWRGKTSGLEFNDTLRNETSEHIYSVQALGTDNEWSAPTICS